VDLETEAFKPLLGAAFFFYHHSIKRLFIRFFAACLLMLTASCAGSSIPPAMSFKGQLFVVVVIGKTLDPLVLISSRQSLFLSDALPMGCLSHSNFF
jgi:hypothetical protein